METINILLYTDHNKINDSSDPQQLNTWGLSELKKFIQYKLRGVAKVKFDFIRRHTLTKTERLTRKLLYRYDEVWIFAVLPALGQPWELNDDEVAALKEWMDHGGGLFITGDHSIPVTSNGCQVDHRTFPNLGRSLGHRIKRAGELRVWEGPPTDCIDGELKGRDNHNTQDGAKPGDLDNPNLDDDEIPQTLLATPGTPHRLFWWYIESNGQIVPIREFPDHGHEGEVLAPQNLGEDWPQGSPHPIVVAQGSDKRFPDEPRIYDLVVAYDGDPVKIGRIVADSSFHHYFNVNIRKLPDRDAGGYPLPKSSLDQVAQYYANLALWLAPRTVRDNISHSLLSRVIEHPNVFEVQGSSLSYLGKVARHALELECSFSDLYRLIAQSDFERGPEVIDELMALIYLNRNSYVEITSAEMELMLGSIVEVYHDFLRANGIVEPSLINLSPSPVEILLKGLARALEMLPDLLGRLPDLFLKDFERLLSDYL